MGRNAYDALVEKYGVEGAKQIMRERRAKVNPQNIKGRPKRKIGSEAEG